MRRRRHKLQVSTFPFLAVLLCAMGALLLVLLVMDRRAHDAARARAEQAVRRAAEEAARDAEAHRSALELAREEARAARQRQRDADHARLAGQVAAVQGDMEAVRGQFAQAGDRLRAEQGKADALKQDIQGAHAQAETEKQAILLVRGEAAKNAAQSEATRKEREEMTADLARLEAALADLKADREKAQKTYSVVPYNGKRGESRRPLYVECAGGQLIFHPDRLSLPESGIASDAGEEVQRRLKRQKEQLSPDEAKTFTPYLMLLVRPDGVISYYRLRDALRGQKIDFGYEFIDADWALDFPADDSNSSQAWMTAAKPVAAPSAAAAGPPIIGVKPGYGPVASADGSPAAAGAGGAGTGNGSAGAGPAAPPDVAASSGPGGRGSADGRPGGHGSEKEGSGSQFASLQGTGGGPPGVGAVAGPEGPAGAGGAAPGSPGTAAPGGSGHPAGGGDANAGSPGAPAAAGPGNRVGDGTAEPGPHGSPSGQGSPPVAGSPGAAASGGTTQPGTANAAPSAPAGALPPVPSPATAQAAAAGASHNGSSAGSPNTTSKDGSNPQAASPGSGGARGSPGGQHSAAADGTDDDPFLRTPPPPLPNTGHSPPALRPARLGGDRDWILYVECKPEGVIIYPTQLMIPASALAHASGSNPLMQTIQQLIDRKQATVRTGEQPYRPEVRFLVHPDAGRTYHLAYPMLDGLAAPKTSQTLTPDDDVSAIVTGH